MKKEILRIVAKMAEASIKRSENTNCSWWTYQPKVPKDLKKFKK